MLLMLQGRKACFSMRSSPCSEDRICLHKQQHAWIENNKKSFAVERVKRWCGAFRTKADLNRSMVVSPRGKIVSWKNGRLGGVLKWQLWQCRKCVCVGEVGVLSCPAHCAMASLASDDLIPPSDLLELIVSWIFEDPRLILITFLNTPIATNLPIGFLELTPLTGLIRWCVKAPLAYKRKKKASLSNGHPTSKIAKDSTEGDDGDCHQLYSKLHLSVLQVLMMLQGHLTEKNLYGRLGLIPFDHVVPLVEEINRLSDELNPLNASKEIELALDRLAQALQVAMASGALLCTRGRWGWLGGRSVGLPKSLALDSFPPVCGCHERDVTLYCRGSLLRYWSHSELSLLWKTILGPAFESGEQTCHVKPLHLSQLAHLIYFSTSFVNLLWNAESDAQEPEGAQSCLAWPNSPAETPACSSSCVSHENSVGCLLTSSQSCMYIMVFTVGRKCWNHFLWW